MIRPLMFVFGSLLFVLYSSASHGETIYVPTDYSSIQSAIDASENGDVILVEAGTYDEEIIFNGKAITLKSVGGPEVTLIESRQSTIYGAVVNFNDDENHLSVLEGFTITKYLLSKKGIKCINSSPIIRGNIIEYCGSDTYIYTYGAGIELENSSALIEENTIKGNGCSSDSSQSFGAGLCCHGFGSPVIINNVIKDNKIYSSWNTMYNPSCGAGIACLDQTSPLIMNNTIEGNRNYFYVEFMLGCEIARGGGIYCKGTGEVKLVNNIIKDNEVEGGCYYNYTTCIVRGGGIYCDNPNAKIINCVFYNNKAFTDGTPIFKAEGGGLYFYSDCTVVNSIIWGNTADTSGNQIDVEPYTGAEPEISYSCIQDGWPGDTNIDQDPLFFMPYFWLSKNSPCINRGTNGVDLYDDYYGDPRPQMGTVDMGIDEYMGPYNLSATELTLSESAGGVIDFTLQAGAPKANRNYLMLIGLSGTNPGYILPGGATYLPINWDLLTDLTLVLLGYPYFTGFMDTLDGSGQAQAQFDTLGPLGTAGLAGQSLSFAYCLGWPWEFASNPVNVLIAP